MNFSIFHQLITFWYFPSLSSYQCFKITYSKLTDNLIRRQDNKKTVKDSHQWFQRTTFPSGAASTPQLLHVYQWYLITRHSFAYFASKMLNPDQSIAIIFTVSYQSDILITLSLLPGVLHHIPHHHDLSMGSSWATTRKDRLGCWESGWDWPGRKSVIRCW